MVEDIEELYDAMQVFSQPLRKGKNVAIVSNAGGLGVVTADWCSRLGLTFPRVFRKNRRGTQGNSSAYRFHA